MKVLDMNDRHVKLACGVLAAGLFALAACNARNAYPDPAPGWHSPDYSTLFGRLTRVPGPTPDDPPTFTLRFGDTTDSFNGEVALTPPERLAGYSGGERVQVQGRPLGQPTTDAYNGRWYTVDAIRMWSGHR
jgi:hypothetical protein